MTTTIAPRPDRPNGLSLFRSLTPAVTLERRGTRVPTPAVTLERRGNPGPPVGAHRAPTGVSLSGLLREETASPQPGRAVPVGGSSVGRRAGRTSSPRRRGSFASGPRHRQVITVGGRPLMLPSLRFPQRRHTRS
jgi:hypothetical protein